MNKYKEGDRFIIELGTGRKGASNMTYYRVKGANTYLIERELDRLVNIDKMLQRLEEMYKGFCGDLNSDICCVDLCYKFESCIECFYKRTLEIVKDGVSGESFK